MSAIKSGTKPQHECNDYGVLSVENHPADSRVKIRKDGTVQTLSSRMGTGGGNVPLILIYENIHRETIL